MNHCNRHDPFNADPALLDRRKGAHTNARIKAFSLMALSASAFVTAACSGNVVPSSCAQAVVGRAPASKLDPGVSGFVQFEFDRRTLNGPIAADSGSSATSTSMETKQCTALFDYPVIGGERRVRVWTAAHCVGRDLAELTGAKALVAVGKSYVEIPLTHDYIELKRNAAARVAAIAPSETAWKTIFAWNLALEAQPVSAPACRDSSVGGAAFQADPDVQDLCFSWSDLLVLVAKAPGNELKALLSEASAHDFTVGLSSEARDLLKAHADLTALKRELVVAQAVDSYFACKRFLASGRAASATDCTKAQNATYAEVLKAYAFPGRNLITEGEARGFSLRKGAAEEDVERKMTEARGRLVRLWRHLGNKIVQTPATASVVTADKETAQFHELKLSTIGVGARYAVEENGLRMRVRKNGQAVVFGPGDSGSIFSLTGLAPLLTLQSVDNSETSGGASVVALPVRRSSGVSREGRPSTASNSNTSGPESSRGRADAPDQTQDSGCG